MASEHDKRYKKLFSHPYFVQKLLQSFVQEDFVGHLDFSTLKRLDKSFVSDTFREQESDLVFQVDFHDNPVYIFLLIEFQSTNDKMMPIRFLRYICEFYASLHRQTSSGLLPAVFPVLLYNGDKPWTAEYQIDKVIEATIPAKYIPRFEYYPILENAIPKSSLLRIRNAVSALFYLENIDDERWQEEIDNIVQIIMDEDLAIVQEFVLFLNNFLEQKADLASKGDFSRKLENAMEVQTMFATKLKNIEDRAYQRGLDQGEKKGEKRGIEKGEKKGEQLTNLKIALRMKAAGYSVAEIEKITGLSEDVIKGCWVPLKKTRTESKRCLPEPLNGFLRELRALREKLPNTLSQRARSTRRIRAIQKQIVSVAHCRVSALSNP